MKKIYKSSLRDLYFHKIRSFVIVFSIVMVISFSLALNSLTINLEKTMNAEQSKYKLAHVNFLFSELVDPSVNETIYNSIKESIGREPTASFARLYVNSKYQMPNKEWIKNVIISIDDRTPEPINQMVIDEGRKPVAPDEILLLTSFAKAAEVQVGDEIKMFGKNGTVTYKVVGLGRSIEFSSFNIAQTGVMFATDKGALRYLGLPLSFQKRNSFVYYIDEKITLDEEKAMVKKVEQDVKDDGYAPIAFSWLMREVSYRKSLNDALKITSKYMAVSTIFIFMIAGVVIFVVTNRYVNDQKIVIGAIYSFGTTKREILASFILRLTILFVIGSFFGHLFGRLLLRNIIDTMVREWGLFDSQANVPFETALWVTLGAYLVLIFFNFLALWNIFRMTPYEAMRGKSTELVSTGLLIRVSKILPFKTLRMAWRNLTRNRTRSALTIISFTISIIFATSILLTHSSVFINLDNYFDTSVHVDIIADVGFQDPTGAVIDNLSKMPEIVEVEPYIEMLAQFKDHPEYVAYLRGVEYNTSMFDFELLDGRVFSEGSNEVVISKFVKANYGFDIGDTIPIVFFGENINFTVVGVQKDMFTTASIVFDLDYLPKVIKDRTTGIPLEKFGLKIYSNLLIKTNGDVDAVVDNLNRNHPDIENAISINVRHKLVRQLIGSQTIVIFVLVFLALSVGAMTVFTTQFISLIERDREFSILRIFGIFNREILYGVMMEGLIIATIALTLALVLSREVANRIWIPLVNDTLLSIKLFEDNFIYMVSVIFSLVTVVLSTLVSFNESVKIKPSEAIRFEFL